MAFDLNKEIHALQKTLRQSEDIMRLRDHPGWARLQTIIEARVDSFERDIILMASDTEKNKKDIQRVYAYRNGLRTILDVVFKECEQYQGMLKKLTHYLQVAKDIGRGQTRQP